VQPQLPRLPARDAAEITACYIRALIRWWSPGVAALAHRPEDNQHDAVQRWEQEGGSLSR
jgi:hypothetical protein